MNSLNALPQSPRLGALETTGLLDTPAEEAFDRVARLAAKFLDAPVAQINLLSGGRQFSKSSVGLGHWSGPRSVAAEASYCKHVASSGEPLLITDTREHPLVRDNPATKESGIVAYAGVPLVTRQNQPLGALCVVDFKPRRWSGGQIEMLGELAAFVMTEIELRLEIAAGARAQHALQAAHDMLDEQVRERSAKLASTTSALEHQVEYGAQTEQALLSSEGRFRALVENIGEIITILDPAGNVRYQSPAVSSVLGYTADMMLGTNTFDFIHPDDWAAVQAALGTALQKPGVPVSYQMRFRHADGSYRLLEGMGVNLLDNPAVAGVATTSRDVTEQRATERALDESERHFHRLVESVQDYAIFTLDANGCIRSWNSGAARITGYPREEVLGQSFSLFYRDEDIRGGEPDREMIQARATGRAESSGWRVRKDGSEFRSFGVLSPLADGDGPAAAGYVKVIQDITERIATQERLNKAEEQLRQAQKMEAIGRLAGGIAHDFNNILTAMKANAGFLLDDLAPDNPSREDADEIRRGADRGAALTAQLLAFSRKQVLQPRVINLNDLVRNVEKMLRRTIGEDIELTTRLPGGLGQVEADPGQIEQVLMNLAVNARDAMPRGGKLFITTENALLDEEYASQYAYTVSPGEYVVIAVTDTGEGMSKAVREQIFDPFFTTKEEGKGTGLGLSTVFGIVKQSGGYIWVYSEEGSGTTLKVYLPRTDASPVELREAGVVPPVPEQMRTVLVVEDDPAVRKVARLFLERAGFEVFVAADGEEAMRVAEEVAGPIHALLTDIVMSRMGGRELAARLSEQRPDIRVLFTSGYSDDAISHYRVLESGTAFLQKPYGPEQLLHKIEAVLAAAGR